MNLAAIEFSEREIVDKNRLIRQRVLERSIALNGENFTLAVGKDLKILFDEIDREYFGGELGHLEKVKSTHPMTFRFSKRATQSGGTTYMHRRSEGFGGFRKQLFFEISISSRLLFLNFHAQGREITVGGKPCASRLEAMQRIMEHEMMHLWEMLLFGKSSCKGSRFKTLIQRIFGHIESAHRLVTPAEKALETHQIRLGQKVEFEFEGVEHVGLVNRINRRATVLVEVEPGLGQPYRNGKHYQKYYIPLGWLRGA